MSTPYERFTRGLLIALAGFLPAAVLYPQSPTSAERAAEGRALAVVEAIASGDVETAWSALRENLLPSTLERRPERSWRVMLGQVTEDLEGAEVTGVSIDGEEIRVSAQADGRSVTFSFAIEPAAPAVLRRRNPEAVERQRRWGPLSVDLDAHVARRGDDVLALTGTELRLLFALLGAPGRVFTRDACHRRCRPRAGHRQAAGRGPRWSDPARGPTGRRGRHGRRLHAAPG